MKEMFMNLDIGNLITIISVLALALTAIFGKTGVWGKVSRYAHGIDAVADELYAQFPEIPYLGTITHLTELVKQACFAAEQNAKNGDIEPNCRYAEALNYARQLLEYEGIEVDDRVQQILDILIESCVGSEIPSKGACE